MKHDYVESKRLDYCSNAMITKDKHSESLYALKAKMMALAVFLFFIGMKTYGQTVITDKLDYIPYEMVKVSGSGWAANEVVNLVMEETPDHRNDLTTSTVADAEGNISLDLYEVQEVDLGASFVLTATGVTSGLNAQTTFTDGITRIDLSQMHYDGNTIEWRHGNAHEECELREGYSQAYTLELKGAIEKKEIRLVLKFDKLKGDVNAFDFITSYNQHPNGANIDPTTTGSSWSGTPDHQYQIENAPSHLSSDALARLTELENLGLTKISIWNGTLTSVEYINGGSSSEQYIEIKFTVDENTAYRQFTKDVLISWGAHLSRSEDWSNNSSGTIPGSPFHMAIEDIKYTNRDFRFDNGQRDRSLKLCEQPKPCDVTINDYSFELDCDMDVLPEGESVVAYQGQNLINTLPEGWEIIWDDNGIAPFALTGGAATYMGTVQRTNDQRDKCEDPFKIEITKKRVVRCGNIDHENATCESGGSITLPNLPGATFTVKRDGEGDNILNLLDLTPGNYEVTVSLDGYCDYVENIEITKPEDVVLQVSTTDLSCFESNDGSISITNDMNADVVVTFDNAEIESYENLAAGEYTVTATKEGYCPFEETVGLDGPPELEKSITLTQVSCYGEEDGQIEVELNSPYEVISIDGYAEDNLPDGFSHGIHKIIIGIPQEEGEPTCITECKVDILCPPQLTLDYEFTDLDCHGDLSTITMSANLAFAKLYISNDGTNFVGYDEQNNEFPAGNYYVKATIPNGQGEDLPPCEVVYDFEITQPDKLELDGELDLTKASQAADCSDGAATINVTGGTGEYTYTWSHDENLNANTAEGLTNGEYSVTVTDENGCELTEEFNILCPRIEVEVTEFCENDAPYLGYKVTLTDFEGVYPDPLRIAWLNSGGDSVNFSPDVVINADVVTDTILWAGAATDLLGEPTDWPGWELDNGVWVEQDVTGDVRDGKVKFSVNPEVILDVAYPLPSAECVAGPDMELITTQIDNPCYADQLGSIDLTVSGGYGAPAEISYLWETTVVNSGLIADQEDQTGLLAGTYKVTVKETHPDAGIINEETLEVIIEQPVDFDFDLVGVNKSCYDAEDDGEIELTDNASNITAFLWSTDDGNGLVPTDEDQSGLSDGTYKVTVYAEAHPNSGDGQGRCEAMDEITLTVPEEITLSLQKVNIECFGDDNGQITVTTNADSYVVLNESNEDVTAANELGELPIGDYTVVASSTDGNGSGTCSVEKEISIAGPEEELIFTLCEITDPTCEGNDGEIEVQTNYEGAIITVNGDEYNAAEKYGHGSYTIVAKIPNGRDDGYCTIQKEVTLKEPIRIRFATSATDASCFGTYDGTVSVTASIEDEDYSLAELITYILDKGYTIEVLVDNEPYDPAKLYGAGEHTISVSITKDGEGVDFAFCYENDLEPVQVNQPDELAWVTRESTNVGCFGEMNGTITVEVTDEDAELTISKDNGPFEPYDPNATYYAGTYKVVADNGSDCPIECVFHICEPKPIDLVVTKTDVTCYGDDNGMIEVSAVEGAIITVNGQPHTNGMTYPAGEYEVVAEFYGAVKGVMCSESEIVNILEPEMLACNLMLENDKTCFGFWNLMTSNVTGGTGDVTYEWEIVAVVNGVADESIDMAEHGWILNPTDDGENMEFVCGKTYAALITLKIIDENGCECGCISDIISPCSEEEYKEPYDEGEQPNDDNLTGFESFENSTTENVSSYPNPFVNNATISFSVPKSTNGTLTIYTADGTPQEVVFDGNINANEIYETDVDASRYGNQVLIYILKTADQVFYGKMIPSGNSRP